MILFPHVAVLLHEILLRDLAISELFLYVFTLFFNLFGPISYECTHLLFCEKRFLSLVLFKEFFELILLFVKFILKLLISVGIRIYQFLRLEVILRHFLGKIRSFFVQSLNLQNLRHGDTHALHVVVIIFHVFKFGDTTVDYILVKNK